MFGGKYLVCQTLDSTPSCSGYINNSIKTTRDIAALAPFDSLIVWRNWTITFNYYV